MDVRLALRRRWPHRIVAVLGQEGRPAMHFTWLLHGIEQMMFTGEASRNVERTLLSSGALHVLVVSEKED
jgi:hypothetical protein